LRASGTTESDGLGDRNHPDQVGVVASHTLLAGRASGRTKGDRRTGVEDLCERGLIGAVVVVVPGHELHPGPAAS
jgi:hypothetical protein